MAGGWRSSPLRTDEVLIRPPETIRTAVLCLRRIRCGRERPPRPPATGRPQGGSLYVSRPFAPPCAVLKPPHLLDFVALGAARSLNLYGGAPGLANQRPRGRFSHCTLS